MQQGVHTSVIYEKVTSVMYQILASIVLHKCTQSAGGFCFNAQELW